MIKLELFYGKFFRYCIAKRVSIYGQWGYQSYGFFDAMRCLIQINQNNWFGWHWLSKCIGKRFSRHFRLKIQFLLDFSSTSTFWYGLDIDLLSGLYFKGNNTTSKKHCTTKCIFDSPAPSSPIYLQKLCVC